MDRIVQLKADERIVRCFTFFFLYFLMFRLMYPNYNVCASSTSVYVGVPGYAVGDVNPKHLGLVTTSKAAYDHVKCTLF